MLPGIFSTLVQSEQSQAISGSQIPRPACPALIFQLPPATLEGRARASQRRPCLLQSSQVGAGLAVLSALLRAKAKRWAGGGCGRGGSCVGRDFLFLVPPHVFIHLLSYAAVLCCPGHRRLCSAFASPPVTTPQPPLTLAAPSKAACCGACNVCSLIGWAASHCAPGDTAWPPLPTQGQSPGAVLSSLSSLGDYCMRAMW